MITEAIKAFFEALTQGFYCLNTKIEKQCETSVLKSKNKFEKKTDKQEDLLLDMAKLLCKYKSVMSKADRIRLNVYLHKIKGVN